MPPKSVEMQQVEGGRNECAFPAANEVQSGERLETVTVEQVKASPDSQTVPEKPIFTSQQLEKSFRILFEKRYRRSVILGVGVPVVCQLTGVNVVVSYSTSIFKDAGFDRAIVGSLSFGVAAIIGSVLGVLFFDRFGRKTMAAMSFSGVAISYLAIAMADLAPASVAEPLSVCFVIVFAMAFTSGLGGINFAYGPEVVPAKIAGVVLGTGRALSLLVTIVLVLVFPSVLDATGNLLSFLILVFFSSCSYAFLRRFMVETKGRELDDIMSELGCT